MTFNLNKSYFSEKFAIWRYLTSKSSKNCQNWGFGHFLNSASLVFLDFVHDDRWTWCLVFIVFKIFPNFQYSKKLKTLSWISFQQKFLIFIYFKNLQRTDSLFFAKKNPIAMLTMECWIKYCQCQVCFDLIFFLQKSKKDFVFLLTKRLDNSHDVIKKVNNAKYCGKYRHRSLNEIRKKWRGDKDVWTLVQAGYSSNYLLCTVLKLPGLWITQNI